MLLDLADDLLFITDVSIRHEANDTKMICRVRWFKGRLDRLHHLRSTASLPRIKKSLGSLDIRLCRGNGPAKKYRRIAGKRDEIECVVGIKALERKLHRFLRFIDRKTVHR